MMEHPTALEQALMLRALRLAASARGLVEPNPMVGCIIHRDGRVIAEGLHRRFGAAHAEPDALANATESVAGADAIVTLEPCCHTNKKTPPCVPALIASQLRRVVVGQLDPNPLVAGRGVSQLRDAGIEITSGVLEDHCTQLNAAYFAFMKLGRPYITLKWAQSAEGLLGGSHRTPRRISSPESIRLVHQLRTRCDALAVSADTVIADNPSLSVRDVPIVRVPRKVILDSNLRTPPTSTVVSQPPDALIYTILSHGVIPGAEIVHVPAQGKHLSIPDVLKDLRQRGVTHLLIEPGERLAHALLETGLWDRLWVFQSPNLLGETEAPRAPEIHQRPSAERPVGPDILREYLNPSSPAFFANIPSPDLYLA